MVVHDWLYSYVYQDGLWLLGGRARGAAMLGVFLVSAVVHEYIFCFVLGFFYPVMLLLFLVFGGPLNFTMHDRRTGPAWNVLMWTLLFLGQGIQVSLYCQEWYARRHCPLPQVSGHDPPPCPLSSSPRRTRLLSPTASPLLLPSSTAMVRGPCLRCIG